MVTVGVVKLDTLLAKIRDGRMRQVVEPMAHLEARLQGLRGTTPGQVHAEVWNRVRHGDPTPFKAFRRNEYLATRSRFGCAVEVDAQRALDRCIVVTEEVRAAAALLRRQGALIFGVSDKPDEASMPTAEQAEAGLLPLHRLSTVAVGQA